MGDEEGTGIGTFASVILIFLVILAVVYVVFFQIYGGSKGALEDAFKDVKKISEEVYTTEKDIELKESNKIADYLEGIFSTKEKDCLIELDLNSFDKDFIIEFNNHNFIVYKKEGNTNRYVTRKTLLDNVYFNDINNFKIKELKEIELAGSDYDIPSFDGKIILYRSLNKDFNFYIGNDVYNIKSNKLKCEAINNINEIIDKYISKQITEIEYLISLMKAYNDNGLKNKALDVYYIIYRKADQKTLEVTKEQWVIINPIWEEIVNSIGAGNWYLCKDRLDNVFRCLNLIIPPMSVQNNCNLEIGQIESTILRYDNLRNCESERLKKAGYLPRM